MHIVLVHIHIKPEYLDLFKEATLDNASNSKQEAGVVRFDVLQQKENPNRFTLVEVYKNQSDHQKHRETAHYLRWRDTVNSMMAEDRVGVIYQNIFPLDENWD